MKNSAQVSDEDFALLVDLQEDRVSPEAFLELEEKLRVSSELRQVWIRLQSLDGDLEKYYQDQSHDVTNNSRWFTFPKAVAAVALGALFLTFWFYSKESDTSRYIASQLSGLEPVAVVSRMDSVKAQGDLYVGATLKPGVIYLEEGELELTFFSGASLYMEGPAELQLLTSYQAYLERGKAAASVPEEAIGFTLKTPEAAVVDLGTEFAVSVDETGDSKVHVYDGEVRVSLLGKDGATLSSSPVLTGDSLQVTLREQELSSVSKFSGLPRVSKAKQEVLNVPEEYVNEVINSNPSLYWNFKDVENGLVTDNSAYGRDGTLVGGVKVHKETLFFEKGLLESSYVMSPPIEAINEGNYSVELWVNPSRFHYSTLAALCRDVGEKKPAHLSVIELMTRSHLIHRPGSIRFLHRWKGGEINVFSETPFLPGHWYHIVGVRDDEHIHLYVNGELIRSVGKERESSSDTFHVVLGQIDHLRDLRQFEGMLDEYALYPRALSSSEVKQHYQSMNLPTR